MMKINKCRICEGNFFKKPLLKYKNMPAMAQYLPDVKSLKKDKGVNLEVCQCAKCGLVQLNNKPVPYYKDVIRASAYSEKMKEFRLKQFNDFTEKYSLRNKKIIEIGCGKGEYLSLMEKTGAKSYGLENLEESVNYCIKNNLIVSKGFIENSNYKLKNSPFDAFFTLNYLEHLPYLNNTLKGIWNNLKKEGVGIVEVPNFDMILRKNLFSEFTADHLFYFTKETLNTTLIKNGFNIIECNEIWYDYIISAIVKKSEKMYISLYDKKIEKLNLAQFHQHQFKIKNKIKEYVNQFKDKNIAIWGAGHQAFAIISLTELSDKIRYVIDSAIFKQGKYTPATHLPIVHPDTLKSDPVDSVIIIAGGYSDEVAKVIKKKYSKNLEISVLRDYGLERI